LISLTTNAKASPNANIANVLVVGAKLYRQASVQAGVNNVMSAANANGLLIRLVIAMIDADRRAK
jgi:hypothetical protein